MPTWFLTLRGVPAATPGMASREGAHRIGTVHLTVCRNVPWDPPTGSVALWRVLSSR
jgi:hypothetical protein